MLHGYYCPAIVTDVIYDNKKGVKKMLFIEYPKCSTCQKARKWLDERKISYEDRHIAEKNPTVEELTEWYGRSGLPLKKFLIQAA